MPPQVLRDCQRVIPMTQLPRLPVTGLMTVGRGQHPTAMTYNAMSIHSLIIGRRSHHIILVLLDWNFSA
jgi:hypothetical protein